MVFEINFIYCWRVSYLIVWKKDVVEINYLFKKNVFFKSLWGVVIFGIGEFLKYDIMLFLRYGSFTISIFKIWFNGLGLDFGWGY